MRNDRLEQWPGGPTLEEERVHAVVAKRRETERGTLDALDQVGGRFRGPIRDRRLVPGNDLVPLARQRAPEGAHLDWVGGLGHVDDQFVDSLAGKLWFRTRAELADGLLGESRRAAQSLRRDGTARRLPNKASPSRPVF